MKRGQGICRFSITVTLRFRQKMSRGLPLLKIIRRSLDSSALCASERDDIIKMRNRGMTFTIKVMPPSETRSRHLPIFNYCHPSVSPENVKGSSAFKNNSKIPGRLLTQSRDDIIKMRNRGMTILFNLKIPGLVCALRIREG